MDMVLLIFLLGITLYHLHYRYQHSASRPHRKIPVLMALADLVLRRLRHQTYSASFSARQQRILDLLAASSFSFRPLLNQEELYIFRILDAEISRSGQSCRLFVQVSLGELLSVCPDVSGNTRNWMQAFHQVNSKRVDFLITTQAAVPLVVIEHQGSGHYQGDAVFRDAVKRLALEKSGIPLIETFPDDLRNPASLKRQIRRLL